MKDFIWIWLFWGSVVFCSLLSLSLIIAYVLYNTAPNNEYTPVFASGFGFAIGFIGLGGVTLFLFDKLSNQEPTIKQLDNEYFNIVIKEMPFLFFALLYFFTLAVYIALFMLVLTYIRNSCI